MWPAHVTVPVMCWMLAKLAGLFYLEMCVLSASFWGMLAGLAASHEPCGYGWPPIIITCCVNPAAVPGLLDCCCGLTFLELCCTCSY